MKQIINGKKYDTETAFCVGSDRYTKVDKVSHWSEIKLYQKMGKPL